MSTFKWYNAVELLDPFVFKILTPKGSGTGFQIFSSFKNNLYGVATAYHVIAQAYEWEQPIKLIHHLTKKIVLLKSDERAIFTFPGKDLAFILFNKKDLPEVSAVPELVQKDSYLKRGVGIGWCGFPAVASNELCFFSGHVSCYLEKENSYLVDGVAINGVSGGPAFFIPDGHETFVIGGVVTAYIPNRVTGETLPGVCFVSSVESYLKTLEELKSLEDAQQKAEIQKEQQESENIVKPTKKNASKTIK